MTLIDSVWKIKNSQDLNSMKCARKVLQRLTLYAYHLQVTGGRNGLGAKLCNIYSTEFIVETADR